MQFANYNAYRVAVQQLIEGDDLDGETFSNDTLDLVIGLGESMVYSGDEAVGGLRASSMLEPLSITPSGGIYTLPADLLELHELYFDATRPIEIVSRAKLLRMGNLSGSGNACYACQNGDTLEFWPASTTGDVLGTYYAKPEALKTVTWGDATTFARYPEPFIYAALTKSAPFLGFDSRISVWQAQFRQAMQAASSQERQRVYGGSQLRMRAR